MISPADRSAAGSQSIRWLPAYLIVPGSAMLLATVAIQVMIIRVYPDWAWHLLDVDVYRGGGAALIAGEPLYTGGFGQSDAPFTYPPFAAALFSPLSLLSLNGAGIVMSALAIAAVGVTVWLLLGARGCAPGAGRLGVTVGAIAVVMWLQPFQAEVSFGQLNAALMVLVIADLTRPDSSQFKGIGVGIAAGIKLVPGIFVLYLVLTGRWRAALTAIGAFAATVVVGAFAAPHSSWQYWTGTFADAGRVGVNLGPGTPLNQSLYAVVIRTAGGEGVMVTAVWAMLAGLALVGGLWLARKAYRRGDDLVGVFVVGLTGLFVSPVSWSFAWVWLAVGLVLAFDAMHRLTGVAQVLAAAVPTLTVLALLAWPMTSGQSSGVPHLRPIGFLRHAPRDGAEFSWSLTHWVMGNINLLVGLGLAVSVILWLRYAPSSWRSVDDGTVLVTPPGGRPATRQDA